MYVYIYVYMYVCICMCVCMFIYICISIYVCMLHYMSLYLSFMSPIMCTELLTCHFFPCPVVYQQGLGDEVSLRDRHCLYLIVCTFLSFVDCSLRLVNYVCLFIVYLYVCLYVCMSLTGEILKIYLVGAS